MFANSSRDDSISTTALTRRHFATAKSQSQSQIHLSWRQLATGRIESARQIVGRVNKAKVEEKEREMNCERGREEESIRERRRRRRRMRVNGRTEGRAGERMSVGTFHSLSQQRGPRVASQTETGDRGLCMNFRSWLRGDKQIASYFCIQRLNGRRVWNDAPTQAIQATIIGEHRRTLEEFQRYLRARPSFLSQLFLSPRRAGSSTPEAQSASRIRSRDKKPLDLIKSNRSKSFEKEKRTINCQRVSIARSKLIFFYRKK